MSRIELLHFFQEVRSEWKKAQQLTWRINDIEKQFPTDGLTDEERMQMIKEYLALGLDLEEIVESLNELRKEWHAHTS